jgi:hypothetical protein
MFEGEGTVTINSAGAKYTRSVVSLTNTDRQIVDFYQMRWPGVRHIRKQTSLKHKRAYVWMLHGDNVLAFLMDVLPYLRTSLERKKFRIVIKSQIERWSFEQTSHCARMHKYHLQMRELNRKGPPPNAQSTTLGASGWLNSKRPKSITWPTVNVLKDPLIRVKHQQR